MPRSQASLPAESVMCGVLVELPLEPCNVQPISNDESPSAPFIMDTAKKGGGDPSVAWVRLIADTLYTD